jgi:hypothetical protein
MKYSVFTGRPLRTRYTVVNDRIRCRIAPYTEYRCLPFNHLAFLYDLRVQNPFPAVSFRVVYGSRARSLYISVFLRKRSFTIVHVRPGLLQFLINIFHMFIDVNCYLTVHVCIFFLKKFLNRYYSTFGKKYFLYLKM